MPSYRIICLFISSLCLNLDLCTSSAVVATDFYCSENKEDVKIEGKTSGRIVTLLNGQNKYANNMACTWTIVTDPGTRIQLKVESTHLQWSPEHANCASYDHVDVRDLSGDQPLLASWCGDRNPKVINSKGNRVQVVFETDASNPPTYTFHGARLTFEAFNVSSCPPDWLAFGDFCYSKGVRENIWASSQVACNTGQANLLSVTSQAEFSFIAKEFLSNSQDKFLWTGLNDIANNGFLRWLDLSTPKTISSMPLPQTAKYYHCVAFRVSDQRLMMKDCERDEFQSICKSHRSNETMLLAVPEAKTNKADSDSNLGRNLRLGILIPAGFLLICIIVGVIVYKKCGNKCPSLRRGASLSSRADHEDSSMPEFASLNNSPRRTSNITPTAPPPSYDDIVRMQDSKLL